MKKNKITLRKILVIIWVGITVFVLCNCQPPQESELIRTQSLEQVLINKKTNLVLNNKKPNAYGKEHEIIIFADSQLWQQSESLLRQSLERVFFTTEDEALFELIRVDISDFNNYFRYKNIIFLGLFNDDRPVSQQIQQLLAQDIISAAQTKESILLMNTNLWAKDQLILFLLGDTSSSISEYLLNNPNNYFTIMKDRYLARINHRLARLNQYAPNFFNNLPFTLNLPEIYKIYCQDLDNRFISFIFRNHWDQQKNPDRYLSVYWENCPENILTEQWFIDKRKELAWNYYDEDEFDLNDVSISHDVWNTTDVLLLGGKYQNYKYYIGGAFQSFAFYHPEVQKIFIIDTVVYYPAGYKLSYLIELECIAQTIVLKKNNLL